MFFKTKKQNQKELIELLEQVINHLDNSEETYWSPLTPNEVKEIIEKEVQHLIDGQVVNKEQLILQFLPTSTLQDISIDNGWGDEYIVLSSKFDKLIDKI